MSYAPRGYYDPVTLTDGTVVDYDDPRVEDEDAIYEAQRERLLEMLEDAGVDADIDELPVDLNPEGDPTKNGAFG